MRARLVSLLETKQTLPGFDVGNLDTLGSNDLDGTRKQLVEWNKTHYQAGLLAAAMGGASFVSYMGVYDIGVPYCQGDPTIWGLSFGYPIFVNPHIVSSSQDAVSS